MRKKDKLTTKEASILRILINAGKPLKSSEIANGDLSINTVRAALPRMIKEKLVEVVGFVPSGKVIGRLYEATPEAERKLELLLNEQVSCIPRNIPPLQLFSALLGDESSDELVEALEALVKEKKKQLMGE